MSNARRRSSLPRRLLSPPSAVAALSAVAQAYAASQHVRTSAVAQATSVEDSASLFASSRTSWLPKIMQENFTVVALPGVVEDSLQGSAKSLVTFDIKVF